MQKSNQEFAAKKEVNSSLEQYTLTGLEFLKSGAYQQAREQFVNPEELNHLGVLIKPGRNIEVKQLLTEDDLVHVSREVGSTFYQQDEHRINMGSYTLPSELLLSHFRNIATYKSSEEFLAAAPTFTDFPERYNPDLTRRLEYEYTLASAEELLHKLQEDRHGPIAGQENKEADVAAYLYGHGVELSADYLTRYLPRMKWYIEQHPEDASRIQAFRDKYGGADGAPKDTIQPSQHPPVSEI